MNEAQHAANIAVASAHGRKLRAKRELNAAAAALAAAQDALQQEIESDPASWFGTPGVSAPDEVPIEG